MLSNELVRLVIEYSNLEGCVALSQVNSEFLDVWTDLDSSLVRERVLERVPWFSLDEECGLDSWRKCALLLVRRSSRALEQREGNRHLYTIRNLSLPARLCCNKVQFGECVDFSKDNGVREAMDPLFSEPYAAVDKDNIYGETLEGTKLLLQYPGVQVDFKTMQVSERVLPVPKFNWDDSRLFVISPSGLTILNPHPGKLFEVVDENDSLLLLRTDTEKSTVLIHKASHPRDESGAYVWSESHNGAFEMSEAMLLPGCGGALKLSSHVSQYSIRYRYLAYVEPSPGLPQVLVCIIPLTAIPEGPLLTTYNGYLYLYCEGRFMRLWIDLGIRSKLKTDDELASDGLRGHALTVWDRRFPVIGSFGTGAGIANNGFEIVRNGRFFTVGKACGLVVGDLETGTTYFNDKCVLSIPYADGDGVGFYTVDNWVYKKVKEKLSKGLIAGEENLTAWWNEACVPQVVRGGDPVFTRVVREEHVTDEPVSLEDGESFDEEPDARYAPVYPEIYKDRPPLHRSALLHTTLFEHFEDHELPLEAYFQS